MKTSRAVSALLVVMASVVGGWAGTTQYVDHAAAGANTGTSWTDAFLTLTQALAAAASGDQIWVAQGTYYPGADRTNSFQMKNGVTVYGGFSSGDSWGDRNWSNKIVILSGDVQQDGIWSNNAYHVVKCDNLWGAALDGLAVREGYADGADNDTYGGGVFNTNSILTLRNCSVSSNYAKNNGGGVYNQTTISTTIVSRCTFNDNSCGGWGGAMYQYGASANVFRNPITDSTFHHNTAAGHGGALSLGRYYSGTITNCTFTLNISGGLGAGVHVEYMEGLISNCVFAGNSGGSGGGLYLGRTTAGRVSDCVFSGNSTIGYGAAMQVVATSRGTRPQVERCTFVGSYSSHGTESGTMSVQKASPQMKNCLFAGNSVSHGGALYITESDSVIENCTLARNTGRTSGGAVRTETTSPSPCFTNCIIRFNLAGGGDGAAIYIGASATSTVSYTDIAAGEVYVAAGGTVIYGDGNIAADPRFADVETGQWTGNAVYNTNLTAQTVLTNSSANWAANSLVGKCLNPDTAKAVLQYYICSNSAKSITVWGDASAGTNGASYAIYDYHEKSREGRWTPTGWVVDEFLIGVHSPCIDAGYTNSPYANEPEPNGNRINMGVYGNTPQASKSSTNLFSGTLYLLH